jgi:M6 family metalloprotease-like protein
MARPLRFVLYYLAAFVLLPIFSVFQGVERTSVAYQGLHPSSPSPALLEKWRQEGLSMPDFSAWAARGIDQTRSVTTQPKGTFKLLVVAVDFSDNTWQVAPGFFDSLIFTPPAPGVVSVSNYYYEVSYGALNLVTLDFPGSLWWKQAPLPYNGSMGYVNPDGVAGTLDDYGWGPYPQNLQGLVEDILWMIDPLVNFANYDNDGDGFVEGVTFIFAGPGAEITGSENDIWSSAWNLTDANGPGPYKTQDGVRVDNFAFDPEYMFTPGDQTIGVYCHELGHALFGLPDLYDYDLSSYGVGTWSLMSYGHWNGATWGSSPAWPDAWSRTVMGFESPVELQGDVTMFPFQPVESAGGPGMVVKLKSPLMGPKEYFLVEYRDQLKFDTYLPGSGLLIWHVDEEKWNHWELNTSECRQYPCCSGQCSIWHPLVALEQADGLLNLENAANYGDAGDPFPGASGNWNFLSGTNPESGSYLASPCPSNSCIGLQIQSIFPGLIQANVSVVCTVSGGCTNILLSEQTGWGQPGDEVPYRVTVQNCSNSFDPVITLFAESQWPFTFFNIGTGQPLPYPPSASIFAGGDWSVGLTITVPADALWSDSDGITLKADPSLPGPTTEATLTTTVPNCVLVVDDDRGAPDVDGFYTLSLLDNHFAFDYWDALTLGSPDLGTLAAHPAVVWFTGTPTYDTLTHLDESLLSSYLNGGGNLFLSSQEYLTDTGRSYFNLEYLRVQTYTNDVGTSVVSGLAGSPVGDGLGPYTFISPAPLSDRLGPMPPSMGAFADFAGIVNALTYDNSGLWRTLFLAWPFEKLIQPDADEVMQAAISWMGIPPRPQADFDIDSPFACVGEVVTFTNSSLDATTYLWDFGDGVTSTLTDTTHVFSTPVTATISLYSANCCGDDSVQQTLPVYSPPVAGFTASANAVLVGETLVFTDTSTDAWDYLWDFGDGITSSLPCPTHEYAEPMTAWVVLTVTNGCQSDVFTQVITVYGQVTAAFSPSSQQVKVGEAVLFTNNSLNAETYLWDFGDGVGTSTELHPSYAYTSTGLYTVTLTASNLLSTDTSEAEIRVVYVTYLPFVTSKAASIKDGALPWRGGVLATLLCLMVFGGVRKLRSL